MYFSEDQRDFAASVADYCAQEFGSRMQRDALTENGNNIHSKEAFQKMADLGWTGIGIPEEYGGSGGGLVDQCIFFEETSRGLAPVGGAGSTQLVAQTILGYGSEEHKHKWLEFASQGGTMSIAMSEPDAGSDAANIQCKAVLEADTYVVSGQKTWASNAHFVDQILLVVRTQNDVERKHQGLTMLLIDPASEGVEIRGIPTMGAREVNDIFLTNARFPISAVLGEAGQAWKQIMAAVNSDRIIIAAQGVGQARRVIEDVRRFVTERKQFGTYISEFQAIRHRIADLAAEIEAARALTYQVAHRIENNLGSQQELNNITAMAKLRSTEVAKRAALEGIQMLGGYGYSTEFDMADLAHKSIAAAIYGGTSEIQREIIAKAII